MTTEPRHEKTNVLHMRKQRHRSDIDTYQLHVNHEADQRLCFRYTNSTIPFQIRNSKPLAIMCGCRAWLKSDQVGNHSVGFLMTRLNLVRLCCLTSDVSLFVPAESINFSGMSGRFPGLNQY